MDTKRFTIVKSDTNTETLIVAFSGYGSIGHGTKFDFYNLLTKHFGTTADLHFYCDDKMNCYNHGVADISEDITGVVEYFKPIVEQYKNTIFLGNSAGGYAASLYGSLLGVKSVIAFNPPTKMCEHIETKPDEEQYRDVKNHINQHTKYNIFGDLSVLNEEDPHHVSHCQNIADNPNVNLVLKEQINLIKMRDDGELFDIINDTIKITPN